MNRIAGLLVPGLLACGVVPVVAQKRAITFDDFIAMKVVSDPQLSPDGKWVAYAVREYSLKENRGTGRIWLAELATGQTRRLTEARAPTAGGAGPRTAGCSDSSPRGRTVRSCGCCRSRAGKHGASRAWQMACPIRCGCRTARD